MADIGSDRVNAPARRPITPPPSRRRRKRKRRPSIDLPKDKEAVPDREEWDAQEPDWGFQPIQNPIAEQIAALEAWDPDGLLDDDEPDVPMAFWEHPGFWD